MAGPRIVLLTTGTRGDVAPFVALALGLRRVGHEVLVAVPASLRGLAEAQGVPAAPVDDELVRLKETAEGRAALASPAARLRLVARVRPMLRRQLDDAWAASQDAAALVAHPKALAGPHLAERLGVPCFVALPLPLLVPTSAFASPVMPKLLPGATGNRLSHWMARLVQAPFAGVVNDWRADTLGLGPRRALADPTRRADGSPHEVLFAFSPTLVPRPADWGAHVHVTGDWPLSEAGWTPPADLVSFVGRGPPPVYVGFGSVPTTDAVRTTRIVLGALAHARVRGILATAGGGMAAIEDAPDTVHFVSHAPHDWLFGRVAAVVHHGGAGTTHAGLRAGRPTVVCPVFGDQPFWGTRVAGVGAGPPAIPMRRLTAARLGAAIATAVTDRGMHDAARAAGAQLSHEDGVARATELISGRLLQFC